MNFKHEKSSTKLQYVEIDFSRIFLIYLITIFVRVCVLIVLLLIPISINAHF